MSDSFDDFCNLGYVLPRRSGSKGVGGGCNGCISPPAILKNIFHEYNFSIISNLFDNNKPYALSKHKSINNVRTKRIIFGEALRIRGKKIKQNFPEYC